MRESDPRFAALERRVGWFLLVTALIVAGAVGVVGVRQGLFTPKASLTFFDDSGRDLAEGMEVVTRGFHIGKVRRVQLNEAGKVQVTLAIEKSLLRWIRSDSTARVVAKALIGDSRIEISPGTPGAPPMAPGGVIAFVREPDLTEVATRVMEEVKPVLLAVKNLVEYLDDPQGDVKQSIANIRRLSAGLVETRGHVDEALATIGARVEAVAANLEALSSSLRTELLPQVSGLVTDGRQLVGDGRQLIGQAGGVAKSLDAFVREDLHGIATQLREELVPQLRAVAADAGRAANAAGSGVERIDRELPAILEKVNASLENIRTITAELVPASREAAGVVREGGALIEDSQALVRRTQQLWPFRTGGDKRGATIGVDSYEIENRPDGGARAPGAR
ncbi:MAG TPA: MlaD family protein [bacterium]